MAEDYKGQFKSIKKEYGLSIKTIKELDEEGTLDRYLESLDSIKNREAAGVTPGSGGRFSKGGVATKKYANPVTFVDNLKKK
jgi:hypothetical protein